MAFVVFDESTRDVTNAKVKAEMIVEKVLDRHLAQCTVTSGITRSPVIPGDLVYSPAWRKGRVLDLRTGRPDGYHQRWTR